MEELRKKQGVDIDIFKAEFTLDFHIDEVKAREYGNYNIDKRIYNVWLLKYRSLIIGINIQIKDPK